MGERKIEEEEERKPKFEQRERFVKKKERERVLVVHINESGEVKVWRELILDQCFLPDFFLSLDQEERVTGQEKSDEQKD